MCQQDASTPFGDMRDNVAHQDGGIDKSTSHMVNFADYDDFVGNFPTQCQDVAMCDEFGSWIIDSGASTYNFSYHKVLAVAKGKGGLYMLNSSSFSASILQVFVNFFKSEPVIYNVVHKMNKTDARDIDLWHHRLGHCSSNILKHVLDLNSDALLLQHSCLICPLAKQQGMSFHPSHTCTTDLFQLIHLDLWGPYKTTTRTGAKKPDVTSMRVFGSLCFAANTSPHKIKFNMRSHPAVFLGYPSFQKAYRLLDLQTHKVFISRDILFHENIFPFKNPDSIKQLQSIVDPDSRPLVPLSLDPSYEISIHSPILSSNVPIVVNPEVNAESSSASSHDQSLDNEVSPVPPIALLPSRQSTRIKNQPSWLNDYIVNSLTDNEVPSYIVAHLMFVANLAKVQKTYSYK
ncbi:hypothetical protein LIER_16065 [Lithospermum erythrorhizon]|uniref:Retroviral polymerase SH3-like domain-containing protein n=1 Tax=Lithospermum erythrorhizon TaxID=34254 RepID=A0AAV3Q9W3_LITER